MHVIAPKTDVEIQAVEKRVEEQLNEYALIPVEERDMSVSIYKQKCLMEAFHLPVHYMFNYRIEKKEDGTGYALVKRARPLEGNDFTLEDRHDVGGKLPTFSERSGFNASFKNHDHDDILFNSLQCSVDWQELT